MSGFHLDRMQADLGLTTDQVARLITRSPFTYKRYKIQKRTGGYRDIAQPARETKRIQSWLIENIFSDLPVHACATAYKSGASIKHNAKIHASNAYLSKFDFKDFFPSITENDISLHLQKHLSLNLSSSEIEWVSRLSCVKESSRPGLVLSIGAPSSPLLSNSVMYDFDLIVSTWCCANGISYSRYADDLAFSSNVRGISRAIEAVITEALNSITYPKIFLNHNKTTHVSKKFQRRITGIIINNEGDLSLGRDRKRMISSLIHQFTIKTISASDLFLLQGLLGFAKDVESDFVQRMKTKYGTPAIDAIFRARKY